nr:Ctr copper transporter domain containing protein [Haemonchus contortus]
MVWSCFVVIAMGVLLEFVRYTRWRFEVNFKNDVQLNTNYMTRLFSFPHVVQTVLFGVQMMYFHFRIQEPILFREWMALNMTGYVFSCIGVAVIAGLYEVVKLGRLSVERNVNEQHLCGCDGDAGSLHRIAVEPGMPCGIACQNRKTESPFLSSNLKRPMHMLSSAIFFLQMFIAYSLMMISMTYNVPIFISLVLGHTLTYFLLGPLVSVQEYEKLGDCCA